MRPTNDRYRRLTLREGAFQDCSLISRAVAKQMLLISDRHGRIEFTRPLEPSELAKHLARRMGASRGDRRILGRVVAELMQAGAWAWRGRFLMASPMVMEPSSRLHPGPKWDDTSVPETTTNVPEVNASVPEVITSVPDNSDKPVESLNTGVTKITNRGSNLEGKEPSLGNKLKIKIKEDAPDVVGDFEKDDWVRAAKIVSDVYREATGDLWMSTGRHRGDLLELWEAASNLGKERSQSTEEVFSSMVRRWADDPWVQQNGYPFARLVKDPTKFASKSPGEKKRDKEKIKYLKNKRYQLLMAGAGEQSDAIKKIDNQLGRLTG